MELRDSKVTGLLSAVCRFCTANLEGVIHMVINYFYVYYEHVSVIVSILQYDRFPDRWKASVLRMGYLFWFLQKLGVGQ